jgi:hypothetical protein
MIKSIGNTDQSQLKVVEGDGILDLRKHEQRKPNCMLKHVLASFILILITSSVVSATHLLSKLACEAQAGGESFVKRTSCLAAGP